MSEDRLGGTAGRQAGHKAASGSHDPSDDMLAGLSSIGPPEIMEKLAELHAVLSGDRTLLAIVVAAEEMATRWGQQHEHVDQYWVAYEKALAAESDARRRLDMLLRTLAGLSESSRTAGRVGDRVDADKSDVTRVDSVAIDGPTRGNAEAETCPPVMARSVDLAICLLGRFRLFRCGHLVDGWHGSKTPRVVRYLFAQRGRPVPRDVMIDLFWPSADPETARRNLHQTIYVIRKVLRAARDASQPILFADEAYAVNTSADMWCDVDEFEVNVGAGRRAEREQRVEDAIAAYDSAERSYGGDFLEDSPYEDWTMAERDRLRLVYLDVANRLADLKFAKGDLDAALEMSQRALLRDSCDEAAHRCALRCHGAAGNRSLVIRQYEACVNALDRAYGLAPTRETTELYASLLAS